MPPIINSEEVGELTEETKEVFVECSGHDKQALQNTLAIIVTALADIGGTIHSVNIRDSKNEESPCLNRKTVCAIAPRTRIRLSRRKSRQT